jgi:MFS family permease
LFAFLLGVGIFAFLLRSQAVHSFSLGWRSIFLVNVPIGILTLLAPFPLMRESRSPEARNLDRGGMVLLTFAPYE